MKVMLKRSSYKTVGVKDVYMSPTHATLSPYGEFLTVPLVGNSTSTGVEHDREAVLRMSRTEAIKMVAALSAALVEPHKKRGDLLKPKKGDLL